MENTYEKDLFDLGCVTGIKNREILLIKLDPFAMSIKNVTKFYCTTGRFPDTEEDDFISQFGFNNWHSLHINSMRGHEAGVLLSKLTKDS